MSEAAETDFVAAMQELSTQATAARALKSDDDRVTSGITALLSAVHSLGQRIETLEEITTRNFEAMHFHKIEAQLVAIRESESVNQKLFDSLHQELISYRDNFVRESLQKPVIRDLLVLFDDLRAIEGQLEPPATKKGSRPEWAQPRGNLQNVIHFLTEVLSRLEVVELEEKETVDLAIHRVIAYEPTDCAEEEGRIVRRIRRGFTWRGSLLRPEEVVVKRVR